MNEWRERGIDRGWDHANYVDAYGPEHDTGIDYPPQLEPGSGYGFGGAGAQERRDNRVAFRAGWKLGVARFHRGLYPDGTRD